MIEGIKAGLRSFNAWEVPHTSRSGNIAAHIMARHAKLLNECNIWVKEPFGILFPFNESIVHVVYQ